MASQIRFVMTGARETLPSLRDRYDGQRLSFDSLPDIEGMRLALHQAGSPQVILVPRAQLPLLAFLQVPASVTVLRLEKLELSHITAAIAQLEQEWGRHAPYSA